MASKGIWKYLNKDKTYKSNSENGGQQNYSAGTTQSSNNSKAYQTGGIWNYLDKDKTYQSQNPSWYEPPQKKTPTYSQTNRNTGNSTASTGSSSNMVNDLVNWSKQVRGADTSAIGDLTKQAQSFQDYFSKNQDKYDKKTLNTIQSILKNGQNTLQMNGRQTMQSQQTQGFNRLQPNRGVGSMEGQMRTLEKERERYANEEYDMAPEQQYEKRKEIDAKLEEMRAQNEELKRQNRLAGYSNLTKNADFEQNSKYETTVKRTGEGKLDYSSDDIYEAVNRNYSLLNASDTAVNTQQAAASGGMFDDTQGMHVEYFMDDSERGIYNYLYKTQGRQKANEYLNDLRPELNKRSAQAQSEFNAQLAEESPVVASAMTILDKPVVGLRGLGVQLGTAAMGGQIDPYDPAYTYNRMNTEIRSNVGQNIAEAAGGGTKGEMANLGYQTVMSMLDNLYGIALGGGGAEAEGLVLGIMGTDAASSSMIEQLQNGVSQERAVILGLGAGTAEVLTEKIGLDNLLKSNWTGSREALKALGRQIFAEGAEEGLADLMNWTMDDLYDVLTSQNESAWHRAIAEYQAQGYTESEAMGLAFKDRMKELGMDMAGGALSGGLMGGGFSAANNINFRQNNRSVAEAVASDEESINELIDSGLQSPEGSDSYKGAVKLQEQMAQGETPSQGQILNQMYKNEQQIAAEEEGLAPTPEQRMQTQRPEQETEARQEAQPQQTEEISVQTETSAPQRQSVPTGVSEALLETNKTETKMDQDWDMVEAIANNYEKAGLRSISDAFVGFYNDNYNVVEYNNAVNQITESALQGKDFPSTVLPTEIASQIYDIAKNERSIRYGRQSETEPGTGADSLRGYSGRLYSETSAERGSEVAEGTGRTDQEVRTSGLEGVRSETDQQLRTGNAEIQRGKATARSLGLKNGTDDGEVTIVDVKTLSPADQEFSDLHASLGNRVHFYQGDALSFNENGNVIRVRGVIQTSADGTHDIYVRTDDKNYSGAQIGYHESYHADIDAEVSRTGEKRSIVVNRRYNQLSNRYGQEFIENFFLLPYKDLYSESPKKLWEIKEEMLADLAGNMNELLKSNQFVMESIYAAQIRAVYEEENQRFKESFLRNPQTGATESGQVFESRETRFSMESPTEAVGNLVAIHNLKADDVIGALELGGFPMPSIAVVRADMGHDKYGDISFVFGRDSIDPAKSAYNQIFGGDAYTPVFPAVRYKPNERVQKRIRDLYYEQSKKIGYDAMRPLYNLAEDMESALNSAGGEAELINATKQSIPVMRAFLRMNGKNAEDVVRRTETTLNDAEIEFRQNFISALGEEKIREFEGEDIPNGQGLFTHRKEWIQDHKDELEKAYRTYLEKDEFGLSEDDIQYELSIKKPADYMKYVRDSLNYLKNGETTVKEEVDREATETKIKKAAKANGYNAWVDDLLTGIEEKKGIRNNTDYFTRSGNRRNWETLHDPITLDGVVRIMRQELSAGGNGLFGANPKGAAQKKYNSISEMKADAGRLQQLPEEEYKKLESDALDKLSSVCHSIYEHNSNRFSNSFGAALDIGEGIAEALNKTRTKAGIQRYLEKECYWSVTDDEMNQIMEAIDEIANIPTGYFEAKPRRAVTFGEVKAAIVPTGTKRDLINRMKEAGVQKVIRYKAGDEADRLAKLNSLDNVRFSKELDSRGNQLSEQQAQYFKDSKVRDENGNLLRVFHGTPQGGFTVFRPASYFTEDADYARVYQNPSASSISFGKTADNPMTYEGYLNITKPFDTRIPEIRKIFEEQYYRKWGTGAPLNERTGLPDWTDGMDLQEFIEENDLDYDGLILDEGGVPDGNGGVNYRGISFVPFKENAFKDVSNLEPTDDPDIRYSQELDQEYLELAKDPEKNEARLREMVEQAARDAKYTYRGYHGSDAERFNTFRPSKNARFGSYKFGGHEVSYFTTSKESAETYAGKGTLYDSYLKLENPYVLHNESDADHKTSFNIMNKALRDWQWSHYDNIEWKLYGAESAAEANKLLYPFRAEVRGDDSEGYELWRLGNNSMFGMDYYIASADTIEGLFDNDTKDELLGEKDDYYFTTDDVVSIVLAMSEAGDINADGVIIPDIFDAAGITGRTGDDIITFSQEQIKSADLVTYDDDGNIIPLSERFNTENNDIRFSRESGMVREGNSAVMTNERINERISDDGSQNNPKYSPTWIVKINPSDFLSMTLSEKLQDRELFDTYPGDYNSTVNDYDFIEGGLKKEKRQTPFLAIDTSTGQVVGHEGRHRMRALEKAGITSAEIFIEFRSPGVTEGSLSTDYKYNEIDGELVPVESMTIYNQRETGQSAELANIVPVNGNARSKGWLDSFGENTAQDGDIRYSRVSDKKVLKQLNSGETVKVYRAMQMIDGKLYPPMAARVSGENGGRRSLVEPTELGVWYQADERPDLIKNGKFTLDKANGSTIEAAYNPYWHTSRSLLNDQFSSAYKRPNLVTVECEVPASELTSSYKAEGAKDAVGEMFWHSGPVSSKLAKLGNARKVILSRYVKVNRIVSDSEAASAIADMLNETDIKIPANVVTPSLRSELEKYDLVETDDSDIRYSQEVEKTYEQLEKEFNALKAENRKNAERAEYFKGETRQNVYSDNPRLDAKKIERTAKGYVRDYGLSMKAEDLQKKLTKYANDFHLGGKDFEQLANDVLPLANEIVRSAKMLTENPEKEITEHIRKTKILVSDKIRSDISDYGAWRRQYFGRMDLSTQGGTPVEDFYRELQQAYGMSLFPNEVMNPTDQLMVIATTVDELQPYRLDLMFDSDSITEATNSVAMELISDVMDMAPHKTFADKQKEARMNLKKEMQQKAKDSLKAARDDRDRRIQELKDHYKEIQQRRRLRKQESADRKALLRIGQRLDRMKTTKANRAVIEEMLGTLDLTAVSITDGRVERLKGLRAWYEEQFDDPDFLRDLGIEKAIARLEKKQISDMDIEDVRELTNILKVFEHKMRTDNKLIRDQDRRDVFLMGQQVIRNVSGSKGNKLGKLDDMFIAGTLTPERAIRRMTDYWDDDPLYLATKKLSDGQRDMISFQMRAGDMFKKWTSDRKYLDRIMGRKAETIKIREGVEVTPAMVMSLYLHSLNDDNMRHIEVGGVRIPDMKLYKKGDLKEAYAKGQLVQFTKSQIQKLAETHLTKNDRAAMNAISEYYNRMSQEAINDVSEDLYGFSLAEVENYFPINTDKNYTKGSDTYQDFIADSTIEGMGFLKERIKANNPIMLRDAFEVLTQSINDTSKFVGLAIPVRNFKKIMNVQVLNFEDAVDPMTGRNVRKVSDYENSVKDVIGQKWGTRGQKYINDMLSDLEGNSRKSRSRINQTLNKVRSNYAGAVLTLNLSVAMKQAASYPTAAAVLGWGPLAKAFGNTRLSGKVDLELIKKYTPLLWYRMQGYSTQELGDIAQSNNFMNRLVNNHKALNWIQAVDLMTTKKLWKASEYYVRDNFKDLEIGTDEYYKEVANIYNQVIEETQPNYTTMQRPDLLRDDNALLQSIMMFKTQPFQNFNVVFDAVGNYQAKVRHYNAVAGSNDKTAIRLAEDAKKAAGQRLKNTVTAILASTLVFAAMTFAYNMLRRKKDNYEDEEGKVTGKSIAKGIGKDMASSAAGMIPFGAEAWELASSHIFGEKYYGLNSVTITALSDMVTAGSNILNLVKDATATDENGNPVEKTGEWWQNAGMKLESNIHDIANAFGIPAANVRKLFNIPLAYGLDAKGEYLGGYEYMKFTKSIQSNHAEVYDLLYDAYKNDKKQFREIYYDLYNNMGFKDTTIKTNMEKRMKEEAGVESVKDLKERFVAP